MTVDPVRIVAEPLIKGFESCVLHPYRDVAGKWTIGWGNRYLADGKPVTADTPTLSQACADTLFAITVDGLIPQVRRLVRLDNPSINALAALTSFAYNEGVFALTGSTLLRLYNAGHLELAASQFDLWVYAGNKVSDDLVNRRAIEKALFLKEDGDAAGTGV